MEEEKIDIVFTKDKENSIISAMKNTHPYEEVVYQIYSLDNLYQDANQVL